MPILLALSTRASSLERDVPFPDQARCRNIGVLFGSQIFGWIGDGYGRKTALILSNLLFGIFTFIAAYSEPHRIVRPALPRQADNSVRFVE